jgi:hypothetical protein
MTWFCPHAEEPTHGEFVLAWQNPANHTPFHVSVALARLGYVDMHPETCWRWYKKLRRRGVKLRRLVRSCMPSFTQEVLAWEERISITNANALFHEKLDLDLAC